MTVDIRLAKVEDADLLSQLSIQIQEMHASQHPDFFKQGVAQNYAVGFFRSVLGEPNMQAWIVEVDGVPAGYLLLELRDR